MKYSFMKEEPWQDGQSLQDVEYFQSCYPESMKRLQVYVAEECDKMDYKGSPMYDQYPDRVLIDQMCDSICRCIPDEMGRSLMGAGSVQEYHDAYGTAGMENRELYELLQGQQFEGRGHGRPPRPPQGPPPWGPPSGPPQGPPPWGPPSGPPQGPPPWGPPPGPPHWGPPSGPPQGPPPWGPPPGPPHWGPPPERPNWRKDLIQILLLNEMQRRRCRNGRCH